MEVNIKQALKILLYMFIFSNGYINLFTSLK